jgi:alpha-N-acetylglucosamine transferase
MHICLHTLSLTHSLSHTHTHIHTQLRLWQLPYEKIVFLDADMIVLQPLDHLFALSSTFAAVPDAFHPCYLNTGFMVRILKSTLDSDFILIHYIVI